MRVYTSACDPIDFCKRCAPTEEQAEAKYGNVGDGPDGRGNCFAWDAEHPEYDSDQEYRCHTCGRVLTLVRGD